MREPSNNIPQTAVPTEPDTSDRRRTGDLLGRSILAGILLYAGLILLADNFGWLPVARDAEVWHWIMLGAGGLLIVEALVRAISPDLRGPDVGRIIIGLILLSIGGSAVFGLTLSAAWWPVILIIVGISMLIRAIVR